jgi:hypothetical protein
MPLTAYGKNAGLTGATGVMKFIGAFTSVVKPPTSGTAIAASLINMTGSKAAGWTNGKAVSIRKLTGSVTGLVAERTYFIVGEVTNGFELALEEGGTGVKVAGHELEAASSEFALLTEVTGGSYKRIKTTWGAAAGGSITDTAAEVLTIPAATTVTDIGFWEAESTGKLTSAVKAEAPEVFAKEGEYKISGDTLEALALA